MLLLLSAVHGSVRLSAAVPVSDCGRLLFLTHVVWLSRPLEEVWPPRMSAHERYCVAAAETRRAKQHGHGLILGGCGLAMGTVKRNTFSRRRSIPAWPRGCSADVCDRPARVSSAVLTKIGAEPS